MGLMIAASPSDRRLRGTSRSSSFHWLYRTVRLRHAFRLALRELWSYFQPRALYGGSHAPQIRGSKAGTLPQLRRPFVGLSRAEAIERPGYSVSNGEVHARGSVDPASSRLRAS